MQPVTVIAVIATLVAGSTALGLAWRWAQGRVRRSADGTVILAADLGVRLASGATLVQFSSEVCAPCRSTRVLLGDVASARDDVAHVDLDVACRPDLARRLSVLQTPTTFILDRHGVVRARIGGAPRRDSLTRELEKVLT